MRDTIHNPDDYFNFYEEVAPKYLETAMVHANRGPTSRYWTVCQERRRVYDFILSEWWTSS